MIDITAVIAGVISAAISSAATFVLVALAEYCHENSFVNPHRTEIRGNQLLDSLVREMRNDIEPRNIESKQLPPFALISLPLEARSS